MGLTNYHVNEHGEVAAILKVDLEKDIIAISSDGTIIRFSASSVRQCSRPSKGVKIMRLSGEATVVSVAEIDKSDSEVDESNGNIAK